MKLIVGLGNPGKDYDKTRHNVGFEVLDLLAKEKNVTFKLDKNFDGLITTYQEGLEKVILLKPTTYMNLSGQSVIKVKNYYKVDLNDILIVVDDINIDLAALRLREKGSAGGHNGLKSLISHLQSNEFKRIRVGIKFEKGDLINHVLGKFSKKELEVLEPAFELAKDACVSFSKSTPFSNIMTRYNTPAIS